MTMKMSADLFARFVGMAIKAGKEVKNDFTFKRITAVKVGSYAALGAPERNGVFVTYENGDTSFAAEDHCFGVLVEGEQYDLSLPAIAAAEILGRVRTEKKAASSKQNGKKGGRPKTSPLSRQEQQREYQRKRRAAAKAKPE